MDDCIFCKIVAKQIPADVQYEDDQLIVFKDIHPKANIHWLIVPKKHIVSLQELTKQDSHMAAHVLTSVAQIAKLAGVAESGYKIFVNTGPDGEQVVPHLHIHFMGGEPLHGPTKL